MPDYKLAAFDMDGTLLDSNKEIRPSAIQACKRAAAAGKIIALDTGRAVTSPDAGSTCIVFSTSGFSIIYRL